MTVRQKKVYKLVLTRNYEALARGKNQVSLINIMMQLRKTCNHVELLQDQEDPVYSQEERLKQLIYGSGKLLLLDKLLTRFREKGDRVLVFSQMVTMLNLLEDYMQLKRYPYQRIDGGVSGDKRKHSIAQFNDPSSNDFCFLLSTKAGGLGINLQTANRVVIFDSDWNPQNDLQAIARAHRIGQKEEVKIFRFVASSSVDEDIIHRAKKKMVLDHLIIQSMDTTGKDIIKGGKVEKKGNVPFDKNELNMILKFGAEDLFKNEDNEEQDKEVDLDAILESAETREEDEAPQSEANKELLSAFKCTNIAFDEDEAEDQEQEQEQEGPGFKDWSEIIPSAMVEEHRPKKGVEMYSDPEELFNPIAMRRKKRNLVKKRPHGDDDSSLPNSAIQSREGSEEEDAGGDNSEDSDMTDGEKEILDTLKKRGLKKDPERKYSEKTLKCLECTKQFTNRKGLRKHMNNVHKVEKFKFSENNLINPSKKATKPEVLKDLAQENNVEAKKKRGAPAGNTRCFPCNKAFQHRLGYKTHIKNRHDGVEPPENLDPKNLALPDDRVACMICNKKFTSSPGLKGHIQNFHLGLNKVKVNKDTEDEDTESSVKEGVEDVKPVGKTVTPEEARLIEKMYYMMRKYGCAFCPVRFNDKSKLQMHESVHAKSKKPVICPYCEKSYSKRDKLKNHIERVHPGHPMPKPSPQKSPEKSPVATPVKKGKKVVKKSPSPRLQYPEIKMVKVDGQDKFQCPYCDQLFTYRKGCIRHMKQFHANEMNNSTPVKVEEEVDIAEEDEDDNDEDNDVEEVYDEEQPKVAPVPSNKKDYPCPVCNKIYASYMSLYMHKKTKHPGIPAKGGSNPVTPMKQDGSVQVLQLGVGGLTPNGRREKIHQCATCQKKYADLKGLATHIEKMHPSTPEKPPEKSKNQDCPYCDNMYSRRDKLYEHIRRTHPGREVPKLERGSPKNKAKPSWISAIPVEDEDSNQSQESSADSINSGFGAGKIYITPVKDRGNQGQQRGKYKQKEFTCPMCSKGYCDAKRLKDHIETKHEQKHDPWKDVGPNTDIAVRNRMVRAGFEVYKVLGLYSTGLRMKAARFAPVDTHKWILTEEINKSVMKHDILAILTTLRKENGIFQLDPEEQNSLQQLVFNSKLRTSTVTDRPGVEEVENIGDNTEEDDNDEVVVQPVFENGVEEEEDDNDEVVVQPVFENGEVHIFTNGGYSMEVDT